MTRRVCSSIAPLIVGAVLIVACGDEPAMPPARTTVTTVVPAAAPPADPGWVGVTASSESVDVAPSFDGVVESLAVRAGDHVEAGAELATLDDRPLREELAAVRAQVREAGAVVRRGLVEIERARYKLEVDQAGLAAGTEATATVEDRRLAVRAAEAAVAEARAVQAQAQARLDRAANRLADTKVRAPFAGTVGLRYVDIGAAVGPRTPVLRLVGGGRARLRFAVPVHETTRVGPGVAVVATVEGWAPLRATVAAISPEVDQASQLIYVDAELDEPVLPTAARTDGVPPGLAARVRCSTSSCAKTRDGIDDGN